MSKRKLTDEQQANKDWLRSLEIIKVRVLARQLETKAHWRDAKVGALMAELCRYEAISAIRREMLPRDQEIRARVA